MVNSAAAIACSIAILEDNRLKDTEEKMLEELRKTFRFISMSCLARAWKVVGERYNQRIQCYPSLGVFILTKYGNHVQD